MFTVQWTFRALPELVQFSVIEDVVNESSQHEKVWLQSETEIASEFTAVFGNEMVNVPPPVGRDSWPKKV